MTANTEKKKKPLEKLALIRPDGVEILSDELFKKVDKGNLSASMANSLLACPADWFLDKYILRELESEEQPFLERGTMFHSCMEAFFAIAPEERTAQKLGAIAKEVMTKNHPHLLNDGESKAWLKGAIMGYLSMGFDFNAEKIATVDWRGKESSGLELFIDGKIGNTKRKVVGYVDKIIEKEIDGKKVLFIEDWKTGKTVHDFDPDKPTSQSNSFDYWRQQTLYSMLMEQEGLNVGGASLIFPVAKKIVTIDKDRHDIRQRVIEDMEKVDEKLDKCLKDNFFPFTPGTWCTWCHLFYNGRKKGRPRFPKINQRELNLIVDYSD